MSRTSEAYDGGGSRDFRLLRFLGTACATQGDLNRAREHLQSALTIANDAQVRFNLALVLQKLGEPDQAYAELERVLQINPGYSQAAHALRRPLDSDTGCGGAMVASTRGPDPVLHRFRVCACSGPPTTFRYCFPIQVWKSPTKVRQ